MKEDSTASTTSVFGQSYQRNTTYYRRVRAKNARGVSDWSQVFSFTTIPLRPGTPIAIYPSFYAYTLDVPLNPILTWRPTACIPLPLARTTPATPRP